MTLATADCIDGNHGNRERPQSRRSNWLLAGWRRRGRGGHSAPPCRVQPKARLGGGGLRAGRLCSERGGSE